MQACKYASMQVCWYTGMQVRRDTLNEITIFLLHAAILQVQNVFRTILFIGDMISTQSMKLTQAMSVPVSAKKSLAALILPGEQTTITVI